MSERGEKSPRAAAPAAARPLEAGTPLVLVTRPEPDGAAFVQALRRAAPGPWGAVLAPLGRIAPRPPPEIAAGADLILTSRNALRALDAMGALGGLAGRRAWCVGRATAEAARTAGLVAVEPSEAGGDAEALVARLLAERPEVPLLHLRGEPARGEVAARLRAAGLQTSEAVVYAQEALAPPPEAWAALAAAAAGRPVLAPVFSPRSAVRLSRAAAEAGGGAGLHAVALSLAVAEALRLPGARVSVCLRPDAAAMIAALVPLLADLRRAPPGPPGA